MIDLPVSWRALEEDRRSSIERELARELSLGHVLAGKSVRAVARSTAQDDVLFEVAGEGYAVVHLMWSGRATRDPAWPSTRLFSTLQAWREAAAGS